MKRKAIIPLVLGLGIGLLAVKFVVQSIQKAQASSQARQVVTVVRAKQDIAAHEEITKDLVETLETADNLFAPANDRIERLEMAVGRVVAKAIPRNMPVLLSMLSPEGTKPGMVGRIPPGFRAVSVKIDEVSGVAYQMQPGDWVDVIVVMDIDTGTKGKKETIAEVILQHVQVAAIGHGTNPEPEGAATKVKPAKSATLLVPEPDVPKLHLAGTRGKITLAMRGEDDKGMETPSVAYGSEILRSLQSPEPAPAPPTAAPAPTPPPAQVRRPRVEPEVEPHSVLVFHHSTVGTQPDTIDQYTFATPDSAKIVAMTKGAPTRASATMSGAKQSNRPLPARPATSGAKETHGSTESTPASEDPSDEDDE